MMPIMITSITMTQTMPEFTDWSDPDPGRAIGAAAAIALPNSRRCSARPSLRLR